jgi:hypothetical protein
MKTSSEAQNMKTGPNDLGTAKNDSGAENMKKRPETHGTAENEFESAKHKN